MLYPTFEDIWKFYKDIFLTKSLNSLEIHQTKAMSIQFRQNSITRELQQWQWGCIYLFIYLKTFIQNLLNIRN